MKKQSKSNQQARVTMIFVGLLFAFLLMNFVFQSQEQTPKIELYEMIEAANLGVEDQNRIAKVSFGEKGIIYGERKDGSKFETFGPADNDALREKLSTLGVLTSYKEPHQESLLMKFLINWLPLIFVVGLVFIIFRQLQAGGGKAMSFGKSRAKLLNENSKKITFDQVAGIDEAKEEVQEIIDFLKNPKKFSKLGGRIPKGVLLVGPPGTGKTILAKGIAGEADVPFFTISGSDFVEMFVGVGASRVRDLFEQAKKNAPCIIFIDEIDAVGRQRGAGLGGGHDEREQTLNQLLVEMDGFDTNEGVILVAATNRPDVLDPALLRPGRFDRQVTVPAPDVIGRFEILKVHSREKPMGTEINLMKIAKGTPGFSGADLENLVNEAALLAARRDEDVITGEHLDLSRDKVMMGPERKSLVMSEHERRNTAFHEAGHCIVAEATPGMDPVHKITIIPRGRALGVTMLLPNEDKLAITKENAEGMIKFAMGGRAAEEVVFGQRTTGAGDDLKKATDIARKMVCMWGMSDAIGPVSLNKESGEVFLGRDMGQSRPYSESIAQLIDAEIRTILQTSYDIAVKILNDKRAVLDNMAEALLIREVLGSDDIRRLMKGEVLITDADREEYKQVVIDREAATEKRTQEEEQRMAAKSADDTIKEEKPDPTAGLTNPVPQA